MRNMKPFMLAASSLLAAALVSTISAPASALADEPAPATPPAAPAPSEPAAAPTPAAPAAEVEKANAPTTKDPSVLIGVRAGASFPQAFNKLGTSFLVNLEVGYQLPFFHHRFGIFVDGSFTQPQATGQVTTAQIKDPVDYTLTQRDAGLALGAKYLHIINGKIPIYVGAGARFHFTRNIVEQKAGSADLGENNEDSTRVGAVARVGGGYKLGPGMIQLELSYEWAPTKHLITGDDNTSFIGLQVGYTAFVF